MKTFSSTAFTLCAFAGMLASFQPNAQANDWPTFRGADRKDISKETGLLKSWPAEGPKRVWTFEGAGLGYSGFAVVGGTLYTLGAKEFEEHLIAVDAATGKEKWTVSVGPLLTNGWGDGPRSSPTVDGDRVYALGGKGDLACVSAKDGKVIWKASLTDAGGKVPGWGYCESPLVDGNQVVVTPGGNKGAVLALDKLTGKQVWQSAEWTDGAQYASLVPIEFNGVRQYVQLTMQNFAGISAKDGSLLWKVAFPGKTAVIPTPIYDAGQVYVAAGYGVGCKSVKLGSGEPEFLYENTNMVNHHGGVILVGDYLYGHSDKGGWTCQNFKTGEVQWAERGKLGKGAIHCADGMLYLLEENSGNVVLIEASPNGWNEKGRFQLGPQTSQRNPKGKIWTHPVVSGGKLYLRDQELIHCYDVKG
ncbi:PQQ-binding-like beta-propeller repeat protein [Verrucomicrobium sp. BvORR034]|uniref:outer membrane protein assembly factor BamB family protein n=1 Tax=Verrucomicrobium sp. BvORR034 TaxID=1396418 RepID=UPI000679994C|nr:PQQ-binding-like beta-propeller repeat protein [Verrucomicrobium sp. BvORR034]